MSEQREKLFKSRAKVLARLEGPVAKRLIPLFCASQSEADELFDRIAHEYVAGPSFPPDFFIPKDHFNLFEELVIEEPTFIQFQLDVQAFNKVERAIVKTVVLNRLNIVDLTKTEDIAELGLLLLKILAKE